MSFEVTGKLIEKYDTQVISDRFRKREFVIEVTSAGRTTSFVDYVKFQITQDKCEALDQFHMNEDIKVSFNLKGNRYDKDGVVRYFTNLEAWRIERAGSGTENSPNYQESYTYKGSDLPPHTEADDLPF